MKIPSTFLSLQAHALSPDLKPPQNPNPKMRFPTETMTLPSYETALKVAGTVATTAMVCRTISDNLIPEYVSDYFHSSFQNFLSYFKTQVTVIIEEFDGLNPNNIFDAANIYLGAKLSPSSHIIKVNQPPKETGIAVTVDLNQQLVDFYKGVKLNWVLVSSPVQDSGSGRKRDNGGLSRSELRFFKLSFNKKYREMVLNSYIPFVLEQRKAIREVNKTVKLHMIDYGGTDYWGSIKFEHPATFDTVAMDLDMKKALIDDLDMFVSRKEYYKRVGKAWKRGYLLYGPPGTGKSSLISAMANYLKFDVYDLDLKDVQCNSDLRRLLIGTSSRSILVIEDVVSSFEANEYKEITLSGLLNFVDGLWSSCGDERILVMTTNHKDRIDPVLLRPGRMDMHLHMSYCNFNGFKALAFNYLKIQEHYLFEKIEELLHKVEATPAEVAGELMKSIDAEVALQGLISFLQNKATATPVE